MHELKVVDYLIIGFCLVTDVAVVGMAILGVVGTIMIGRGKVQALPEDGQ